MSTGRHTKTCYCRTSFLGCLEDGRKMQHGDAPEQLSTDDAKVVAAGYRLKKTPKTMEAKLSSSLDLIILDLVFFWNTITAIKSGTVKFKEANTIGEKLYKKYSTQCIDDNFLTLLNRWSVRSTWTEGKIDVTADEEIAAL